MKAACFNHYAYPDNDAPNCGASKMTLAIASGLRTIFFTLFEFSVLRS